MTRISRFIEDFSTPVLVFFLNVLFAVGTIALFLFFGGDPADVTKISTEAEITFIAAFTGILLPILINRGLDSRKDRRTLAFTLGLIWHELLYNKHLIKEVKGNLKPEEIKEFTGNQFVYALSALKSKVDSVNKLVDMMTSETFIASQASGSIRTLRSDDLFNSIIDAYQYIKDVQFSLKILQGNAAKNGNLLNTLPIQPFDINTENKIKDMIVNDINSAKNQCGLALIKVSRSIKLLDSNLNNLGVSTETTTPS